MLSTIRKRTVWSFLEKDGVILRNEAVYKKKTTWADANENIASLDIIQKNGFYFHNLGFMLNQLILIPNHNSYYLKDEVLKTMASLVV